MNSIQQNAQIIEALKKAFNMELETVVNYIAVSTNLDGVRAKHIKDELASGFDPATEDLAITALADEEEY